MPFDKKFPSDKELDRVKAEHDYFKLYDAECFDQDETTERGKWRLVQFFEKDKQKAKILDRIDHICPGIVNGATDFLFGEPIQFKVDSDDVQKKIDDIVLRNNLHTKLAQSSPLAQSVGHCHFKLYRDADGNAVIEEVPYDYWFPNWDRVPLGQDPQNVRIVVYLTGVIDNQEKRYIFIEDWYMRDSLAVVAKSLWEDQLGRTGEQVSLDTLKITVAAGAKADPDNPLTMIEETGLKELPLVTVNTRMTVKSRFGQSEFKKIMPLLHEVNDRLTQLSVQFLKHLNAKLQVPEGAVVFDKDGKVQSVNLEVLIARSGEPEAKYITNENPMIEQIFEHLDKLVRKIAKRTQTPDSMLIEDEKGGVESVESLRTRMMFFLKKIRFFQMAYEPQIIRLMRLALQIEGVKVENVPITVVFDPGLPKEWKTDEEVWGSALNSGIASRETAVSRFQGIEGDELKDEIKRIEEDEDRLAMTTLGAEESEGVSSEA